MIRSVTMFLNCQCAIENFDHLINMLKNNTSDNRVIDGEKMHRSKCTDIIKKVLCAHFDELKR